MRELAILTFVSLDGVMQGPTSPEEDPSGGFTGGGWAQACWDGVMAQVGREAMAEPYDMLFGRKTYETFAGHWPDADPEDPAAARMNGATKYVASSTLTDPTWQNTIVLKGDVVAEIANLKQQDGLLLQVHGSGHLIQTLLRHDLIDEFRLWTFPVVVGSGKRLFSEGTVPASLTLAKSEATGNGAVMSIYRR
ncbi:MAG: dihydrofolate reductase family protein [Parvibaculaceae bacterium]|nr:dihydrofolate reductase family protein [Parvibaculaceae bacterium]